MAAWHAEGHFELVSLADAELPVGTGQIDLGEEAGASGLVRVDELLD
jgi:hypothetical protein